MWVSPPDNRHLRTGLICAANSARVPARRRAGTGSVIHPVFAAPATGIRARSGRAKIAENEETCGAQEFIGYIRVCGLRLEQTVHLWNTKRLPGQQTLRDVPEQ
jgi:hypothetical protein